MNSGPQGEITAPVGPSTVYGFVHVMKTAGTSINGRMAARYDNVCGNKGYSYDFVKAQEEVKKHVPANGGEWRWWERTGDLVSKSYGQFSRTNLDWKNEVMDEIGTSKLVSNLALYAARVLTNDARFPGYESCDWVALESPWTKWVELFRDWPFPLELHVPCRDPIKHLTSECNHKGHSFRCTTNETVLHQQIQKCLTIQPWKELQGPNVRFHKNLTELFETKCFNSMMVDEYVEVMAPNMRARRWQVDYVDRPTNKKHNKEQECLRDDANAEVRDKVLQILFRQDHLVQFCDTCIGTGEDLLAGIPGSSDLH